MIIVGAGIAGSALARQAQDRGIAVTLIDDGQARLAGHALSSRVFTMHWAPADIFLRSKRWYEKHGWLEERGAYKSNFRFPELKLSKDYWLVKSMEPLLDPNVRGEVTRVGEASLEVKVGDYFRYYEFGPGRPLVLATGNKTNVHLPPGAAPNKQMWSHWTVTADVGKTWDMILPVRLVVYMVAPYQLLLAVNYGDRVAVGAVMRATLDSSMAMARQLTLAASHMGLVKEGAEWTVYGSQRSIYPGGVDSWSPRPIRDNVWLFSGFASDGYCLAPGRAELFLDELEAAGGLDRTTASVQRV